jgi:hypothetical protein
MDLDLHGSEICIMIRQGCSDRAIGDRVHASPNQIRYWRRRNGIRRTDDFGPNDKNGRARVTKIRHLQKTSGAPEKECRLVQRIGALWQERADELTERVNLILEKAKLVDHIREITEASLNHEMKLRALERKAKIANTRRVIVGALKLVPFVGKVWDIGEFTSYFFDNTWITSVFAYHQEVSTMRQLGGQIITLGLELGVPEIRETVYWLQE